MEYRDIKLATEQWVSFLNIRPTVFWVACFIVSIIITSILFKQQNLPPQYLLLCGLLELGGLLLVPFALQFCKHCFLAWARSVHCFIKPNDKECLINWYNSHLRFFETSKAMLFSGGALGLMALFAYYQGGFFSGLNTIALLWLVFILFISAFLAGCGLWVMYCGAKSVAFVGSQFKNHVVVTRGRFGVMSTGRMLAKCWVLISCVWFVFTLTALIEPKILSFNDVLHSVPVLVLAIPTLPLILGCYIGCQIPLHEGMVLYKQRQLLRIENMLAEASPDNIQGITKEKLDMIDFLNTQWIELNKLPEWPFNTAALSSVGGSAFSIIFPLVAKMYLPPEIVQSVRDLIQDFISKS